MSADQWTEPDEAPVEETEVDPVAGEEPQVAGTPADESPAEETPVVETPEVTVAPAEGAEIEYPLVITTANADDIVFEDENASADVPPQVAEQLVNFPSVEVVA